MGHGACASGDPLSAGVGRDLLAAGGNAMDAAVGAALMACFNLPTMTGLGGAGVMTVRHGDEVVVLDGFSNLPGLGRDGPRPALEEVVVHFEGVAQTFFVGPASVAVPGTVAVLWDAHRRFGRMPLAEVAAPAIRASREGAPVTDGQYRAFALLEEIFRRSPASWALIGTEHGLLHAPDTTMSNPELATTIEQLVELGPEAFYGGDIAEALSASTDGLLTREDLAAYAAVLRRPLRGRFRDWSLYVPSVPSLTGALLLAGLAHVERGPRLTRPLGAAGWTRIVDALRASASLRTSEYEARLFEDGYLEGVAAMCPGGSTMHIATIDDGEMAVSYTTTLGESAGIVAPGTGVALNNFLGELDIHTPESRRLAGERMTTGMCPALACDAHGRWLSVGSAGSARIRSALLQVLVHVIDGGASLPEAVGRPRIHVEGDTLYVEGHGRTERQVRVFDALAERIVATWGPGFFFGGAQAVRRTAEGFEAGAEVVRRGCASYVV